MSFYTGSKLPTLTFDASTMSAETVFYDDRYGDYSIFQITGIIKKDCLNKAIDCLKKASSRWSIYYTSLKTSPAGYDIDTYKVPNYNYYVFTATRKDVISGNEDNPTYYVAIYYKTMEEFYNYFYEKIYKLTPVPMMRSWANYVYNHMTKNSSYDLNSLIYVGNTNKSTRELTAENYKATVVSFTLNNLKACISAGLRSGELNINGTNTISESSRNINGLDTYLDLYGDVLTDRIKNSFAPTFVPGTDDYSKDSNNFDDYCYYNGLYLLPAQKALVEAASRKLDMTDSVIVVGETGAGKTPISIGIVNTNAKMEVGKSILIMCPGHLCYNWTNELRREAPNCKTVIIDSLSDLQKLEPEIKNKKKDYNLYVIVSYETAKTSFSKRPLPIWSESKHGYVCPECGRVLYKKSKDNNGNVTYVPLEKTDFAKETTFNATCDFVTPYKLEKVFDDTHAPKSSRNAVDSNDSRNILYSGWDRYIGKGCGCELWGPLNRLDSDFNGEKEINQWMKLGANAGWINKQFIDEIYNDLDAKARTDAKSLSDAEQETIERILDVRERYEETGVIKTSFNGVRKYPIAKYIKKKLDGVFDYFICDEIHELKSLNSDQGQALGLLCRACKKSIGLTGTLLNGYAWSLFYLLYRFMPGMMKAKGYSYDDCSKFQRDYGVMSDTTKYRISTYGGEQKVSTRTAPQPGISPLIFTDFLLETGAFISLSDMADGLPNYTESIIGVDMDNRLAQAYDDLQTSLRRLCSYQGVGSKAWSSLLQNLMTYPDMPYNSIPILNPVTKEVAYEPTDLGEGLRNKENRLVELVQELVESGEKVLVYYEYTNRTDVGTKLTKALNQIEGIKAFNLTRSNSKKANREITINKHIDDGYNVMLCNSGLVKTGLNLLDFTSIIFYQISYCITDVRQASRRSWRLSQHNDVHVYFMYYRGTMQENAIRLMSKKMKAACVLEGKAYQEGLAAMTDTADFMTAVASSVINGINDNENIDKDTVVIKKDMSNNGIDRATQSDHERRPLEELLVYKNYELPTVESKLNGTVQNNNLLKLLNSNVCTF